MKRFEVGKKYGSKTGMKLMKVTHRTACFVTISQMGQLGWANPKRLKIREDNSSEYVKGTLGETYYASILIEGKHWADE